MEMMKRALLTTLALALTACGARAPARWAEGGAALDLPRARATLGYAVVDLLPDGRVLINGTHDLTVDRAGRVVNADGEAVAMLERDGKLSAPDDALLGAVGWATASKGDATSAWLMIHPNGELIRFEDSGERVSMGVWVGCGPTPRASQACLLVSHVLATRGIGQMVPLSGPFTPGLRPGFGPGLGTGIGIGVGR